MSVTYSEVRDFSPRNASAAIFVIWFLLRSLQQQKQTSC